MAYERELRANPELVTIVLDYIGENPEADNQKIFKEITGRKYDYTPKQITDAITFVRSTPTIKRRR